MDSPCKSCPNRKLHCHSSCKAYGDYSAMFEKIRQKRLQEQHAGSADAERGRKIRRDVRRYGLYKTGKS